MNLKSFVPLFLTFHFAKEVSCPILFFVTDVNNFFASSEKLDYFPEVGYLVLISESISLSTLSAFPFKIYVLNLGKISERFKIIVSIIF